MHKPDFLERFDGWLPLTRRPPASARRRQLHTQAGFAWKPPGTNRGRLCRDAVRRRGLAQGRDVAPLVTGWPMDFEQ